MSRFALVDRGERYIEESNPLPVALSEAITAAIQPNATDIEYGAITSLASATQGTVKSFTVTGSKLFLSHVEGSGTGSGTWEIEVNSVLKVTKQTTAAAPNFNMDMFRFILEVGDTIDIKVFNNEGGPRDFNASIHWER